MRRTQKSIVLIYMERCLNLQMFELVNQILRLHLKFWMLKHTF